MKADRNIGCGISKKMVCVYKKITLYICFRGDNKMFKFFKNRKNMALIDAVEEGDLKKVRKLLDKGAGILIRRINMELHP